MIGYFVCIGILSYIFYRYQFSIFVRETDHPLRVTENDIEDLLKPKEEIPEGWYGLMDSRDLAKKTVHTVQFLGIDRVLFRGEDGIVTISENPYCPHNGAHLGDGDVVGNCLRCPYHAWLFDHDGICKNKKAHIPIIPAQEFNGVIMVWYPFNNKPQWHPDHVIRKEWSYRGKVKQHAMCHIQEIPENGADIAHFGSVHRSMYWGINAKWRTAWHPSKISAAETMNSFTDFNKVESTTSFIKSLESHIHYPYTACLLIDNWLRIGNYTIPFANIKVFGIQTGPALVYLFLEASWGKGVLIQTVTPMEYNSQRIEHRLYCDSRVPYFLSAWLLHGESVQVHNDIKIWNKKQFREKLLVASSLDDQIERWRSWYSQFYQKSPFVINAFSKN